MESMSVNELERTNQSTSAALVWDTTPLLSLISISLPPTPPTPPLSHFQSSWKKDKITPLPILSHTPTMASGSSKRARGGNNGGNQPVCCLVDGCNSDLSNCRDYHRRHKVCELHSKTPQVSIAGLKQRFCQQCSRFHSLEEFDEGKRSCRKRLDGHNRRRRKPQTDLLPRSGGPYSYHQGAHLLPFTTSSQVFPSTTVSNHGWSSAVSDRGGDIAALHCRNQQLNFLEEQSLFVDHNNYKAAQPLAFLHGGPTTCQPLLRSINTLSENGGGGGGGGGERNKMIFSESDCALSLLSSPQPPQAAVSLLPPLSHHHNGSGFEHSDCSSGRIPHDAHGGAVNFTGIFGIGSDEAGNQSPSTLPFHWE